MESELVLYIGGEFDDRLLAEFITCEDVESIKFYLYDVLTNQIVSEYESRDKMFHYFTGLKPGIYKAVASVQFKTKTEKFESKTLDVHKYLKFYHEKRHLLSSKDIRCYLNRTNQFRFGKKYIYKHHLYDNVKDYRIEVGFASPEACEEFLRSSKYKFCRVYTDDECNDCDFKKPNAPDCVGCNNHFEDDFVSKHKFRKYDNQDTLCLKERFHNKFNVNHEDYSSDEEFEKCNKNDCCLRNPSYYYRLMYVLDKKIARDELINVAQILDASPLIHYTSITPTSICELADEDNKFGGKPRVCGNKNLQDKQLYLGGLPGLNVLEAWEYGATGGKSVSHMIDYGFHPHMDLCHRNILVASQDGCSPHHGVATAGIVAARKNGYGVTGIACDGRYVVHDSKCLTEVDRIAEPGQVFGINVEFVVCLPRKRYVLPVTDCLGLWIRFARAASFGAIIMCNAGNGGLDLYNCQLFNDHGDCGANLVAAVDSMTLKPTNKTNRNHRSVVFNAWGNSVTTCGYGPLTIQQHEYSKYTENYQGTSAALPQVVGVVAVLLDELKRLSITLNFWELRKVIKKFGDTRNATIGAGTLPNLGVMIREIQKWVENDCGPCHYIEHKKTVYMDSD